MFSTQKMVKRPLLKQSKTLEFHKITEVNQWQIGKYDLCSKRSHPGQLSHWLTVPYADLVYATLKSYGWFVSCKVKQSQKSFL